MIGVAISTTGDAHRMNLLSHCVAHWRTALPLGSVIVVTVDGSEEDATRARGVVDSAGPPGHVGGITWRVGQGRSHREGHQGVAVNKNTGIEVLLDAGVTELFLSDDDCWPRDTEALKLHLDLGAPHSMVCWGRHRHPKPHNGHASWSWPRGVMMYVEDHVIDAVGGMVEDFGPGGHEHVEWSKRIFNAGFTPFPFTSPTSYATYGGMGAAAHWHAEDMPRKGESLGSFRSRKRALTSVRTQSEDWPGIDKIMTDREGNLSYVPFRAAENGRTPATMSSHNSA